MKFNRMRSLALILIGPTFAASSCLSSKGTTDQSSSPPTVNFCYLVRNAEQFSDTPIRTQAILHRDPENVAIYDPNCDDKTTHTWAEYDESLISRTEDRKKLEESLCKQTPCRTGEARVTVVGKLSGPYENGYGHLNDYRFRFSILRVERAESVRESSRGTDDK